MSFSTEVELGISVDSGELRGAKRAIEDELGDVTVGVSTEGRSERAQDGGGGDDGSAVGAAGHGAEFEILRRTLKAQEASADFDEERNELLHTLIEATGGDRDQRRSRRLFRWARQRTGYMEETVELLTNIEEDLDEAGGLMGGDGGGGGGLPTIIPTGTPSRPSMPGGRIGAAARVGLGATVLPLLASQLFQQREDISGQGEGLRAALMASPIGMGISAAMNIGGGLSPETVFGGTFSLPSGRETRHPQAREFTLDQENIEGFLGGGGTSLEDQQQFISALQNLRIGPNEEPPWLDRLERILDQDLRITIDGRVVANTVDATDVIVDNVREQLEDEITRGTSGTGRTNRLGGR